MKTVYLLKKNSVIFHPIFDKLNGHSIYVFDVTTFKLLKLKKVTYILFHYLNQNPRSTQDEILLYLSEINKKKFISTSELEIRQIIDHFVKIGIIQTG